MRRWLTVVVVVLAVLDLAVLAVGYRARAGVTPRGVPEAAFTMLPPSSESSTPTGESITGPVLMAVDADGLLLRASRGACQAQFANPAQVAVGSVSAGVTAVDLPALGEVLGVGILPDDHLRVSGLTPQCDPATFDSTDSGKTWQRLRATAPAGIWRLDADTTADQVTGPAGGTIPLACAPQNISNLADSRGAVSCLNGAFYVLAPRAKPVALAASGYDQLSVAGGLRAGRYFVLGATAQCPAQVGTAAAGLQSVSSLECLGGDRAPLGIAAAGNNVVVQVGNDLMVSDDGGQNFSAVG
jgi:hypothetical protein